MGAGTIVKSGFFKASVYNPETGDVVQFNKIAAEFTEFAKEPIMTETSTGQIFGGFDSRLTIGFVETDGLEQIEEWQTDATKINAVVAGVTNILWYEDVTIKVERGVGVNARDGVAIHQVTLEHVSYIPAIQAGVNLLNAAVKTQGFTRGWADSNNDNLADGYSVIEASATDFTAPEQTITGDGNARLEIAVVFPVTGADMSLSSLISKHHSGGSEVSVEQRDYSDTFVSDSSASATSTTTRTDLEIAVQSGVYTLLVSAVKAQSVTGSETQIVSDPALRSDKSGKYVAG